MLNEAINKSDITGIFDSIFTIGVEELVSEIHFKPSERYGIIAILKEGVTDELIQYPLSLHKSIILKLKIESGQMNPDVSNVPQEARVSIITKTYKEANLYVKIIPVAEGEELIIQIVRSPNNMQNPSLG